jgi:hypothetical protein
MQCRYMSGMFKESLVLIGMHAMYVYVSNVQRKPCIDRDACNHLKTKWLRSKCRSSPCIFHAVVSLSIQSFLIIPTTYTGTDRLK